MTIPPASTEVPLRELQALPPEERLAAEMAAVADLVDAEIYLRTLPELSGVTDPVEHFCTTGWRQLRRPNADFDVWWYWVNHLDPADDSINPLVHYALVGRDLGLSTRPSTSTDGPGAVLPTDRPVRRATLFAGFDADGIVDEATLVLIRDLARFGDVFCLFDNFLPEAELAKLEAVATAAWAIRHGSYDFGSYAMLARDLVGWERLAAYDEVLFVNDSSYLVRPLDDVFARMSGDACDWWGLQATKGLVMTRHLPENQFTEPLDLVGDRDALLAGFEDSVTYDFHVASYFLAFRRPVLNDPRFRRFVDAIGQQSSKLLIIQKYEIGLTHLLIGWGHRFATFEPDLYPLHPVYTESAFALIESGFPVLKRYLIYQNHYDVPGLSAWKERILTIVPDAPVEAFERHLGRTAPADRVHRSYAITRGEDGEAHVPQVVVGRAYQRAARDAIVRPDQWTFVADAATGRLPTNARAILEAVRHDRDITKVVLTGPSDLHFDDTDIVAVPRNSPQGRDLLMTSGAILVRDRPAARLRAQNLSERHVVVGVRGGLRLTAYGRLLATPRQPPTEPPATDGPLQMLHPIPQPAFTGVLTASDIDHIATIAAHWPARYADGWRTGLPAHDWLVSDAPPPHVVDDEERVRGLLAGRRLVLLATTQRRSGTATAPYPFSEAQIATLADWAKRHDAVWGIREPFGDLERAYQSAFGSAALDLSERRFESTAAVLRATSVVVTDYAGIALDFTVTDRPVISFAHDLDEAADRLMFDLEHVFPGPVCRDFDQFVESLSTVFDAPTAAAHHRYTRSRDLMVERIDDQNAARAVAHIRTALEHRS